MRRIIQVLIVITVIVMIILLGISHSPEDACTAESSAARGVRSLMQSERPEASPGIAHNFMINLKNETVKRAKKKPTQSNQAQRAILLLEILIIAIVTAISTSNGNSRSNRKLQNPQ